MAGAQDQKEKNRQKKKRKKKNKTKPTKEKEVDSRSPGFRNLTFMDRKNTRLMFDSLGIRGTESEVEIVRWSGFWCVEKAWFAGFGELPSSTPETTYSRGSHST